jgi:hypothetical protein
VEVSLHPLIFVLLCGVRSACELLAADRRLHGRAGARRRRIRGSLSGCSRPRVRQWTQCIDPDGHSRREVCGNERGEFGRGAVDDRRGPWCASAIDGDKKVASIRASSDGDAA